MSIDPEPDIRDRIRYPNRGGGALWITDYIAWSLRQRQPGGRIEVDRIAADSIGQGSFAVPAERA